MPQGAAACSSAVREPFSTSWRSATTVLRLSIDEASAKVRIGDPVDDDEDYGMDVWAGVLPLSLSANGPIADARLEPDIETPNYVLTYKRGR